jgi:Matrixin
MTRRGRTCAIAGAAVAVAALAAAPPSLAASRVIAVDGVAKHRSDMRVEILVEVKAGASASAAAARALEAQGAKPAPPESAAFTVNGLVWNVLPVVQNYNPAGQTTGSASTALTNTHATWNAVSPSAYAMRSGGTTSRCPSLVKECPGPQVFDRFNDVGWSRLSGSTLGVTWFSTTIDEADMAINTRFPWSTGCTQVPGRFDLQTVFLHENGHVAGLGHSSDINAVMYPSYTTARCALGQDDINGLNSLY